MKHIAIYPGSFDPVTNGHVDILNRAIEVFDFVIMGIVDNPNKKCTFTPEERRIMLEEIVYPKFKDKVKIDVFAGLLVHYVKMQGARTIIRGLRAVADFEYEFQLASMNRRMEPEIDTVFLMTDEKNFYVSSSIVREVARLKGNVSDFVPPNVVKALNEKFA